MAEFTYEITERIAVLSTNARGWERQLNMISWNGNAPKYDIRDWSPDGTRMAKGISLTDAYNKLVTNVGTQAAQSKSDSAATSVILDQAQGARDSLSQVNLDEETGNLVKYQQYYTASSQIIKAAQETFATLINSL